MEKQLQVIWGLALLGRNLLAVQQVIYTFRPLGQLPLAHVGKNHPLFFELLSYISSQDIHF